jgi:hypothetical protein
VNRGWKVVWELQEETLEHGISPLGQKVIASLSDKSSTRCRLPYLTDASEGKKGTSAVRRQGGIEDISASDYPLLLPLDSIPVQRFHLFGLLGEYNPAKS